MHGQDKDGEDRRNLTRGHIRVMHILGLSMNIQNIGILNKRNADSAYQKNEALIFHVYRMQGKTSSWICYDSPPGDSGY